jgi:hypothetical protein
MRGWMVSSRGVLAACEVVCMVCAVVSRSVFCCVGIPCVGSPVRSDYLTLYLCVTHTMGMPQLKITTLHVSDRPNVLHQES